MILSSQPDGSQSTITVGFSSGPNPSGTSFSVKCVPAGENCDYPSSGDGAVTGPLSKGKVSVNATVVGLESGASYTCYVAATLGKFDQCKAARPNPVTFPTFYRAANQVTIRCPNADVGDTGVVDGVEYTYRNEAGLRELASNANTWNLLTTTCISGVEDLSSLFDDTSVGISGFFDDFNVDISTWDTSSVADVQKMFFGAASFNQTVEYWDTSNVEDMDSMFENAVSFDQKIETWDTSNVRNMRSLFAGATGFNQPINGWDTGKVKDMNSMFGGAILFNQPINSWVTSNVRDMDSIFAGAVSFNQPIDMWDMSNVEDMESMFNGATSFNQSIGIWDTKNAVDMRGIFEDAVSFNQPINAWDTSNVEDMDTMFKGALAFNQPLDTWNTSRVTDMDSMFEGAVAFDQNLTMWDVSLVSSCFRFAEGAVNWPEDHRPALTCPQCFPADAIVYTEDRGPMQIQHVRIGDRLLTYSDSGHVMYDEVYMIGHKDATSFGQFVSITASNNQTIRLTADHHILVVRNDKKEEIPSGSVKVGDMLIVDHGKVAAVVEISRVRSQGLFNPYTKSGRIVVDGILASCHSSSILDGLFHKFGIPLATGYQTAFAPIRLLYSIVGPQVFLRLEWIIDEAAAMCNGDSYEHLVQLGQRFALTSMVFIMTVSTFTALKPKSSSLQKQ